MFYTDAKAQALYQRYVEAVVTRVNTITGVMYRCVCVGWVGGGQRRWERK